MCWLEMFKSFKILMINYVLVNVSNNKILLQIAYQIQHNIKIWCICSSSPSGLALGKFVKQVKFIFDRVSLHNVCKCPFSSPTTQRPTDLPIDLCQSSCKHINLLPIFLYGSMTPSFTVPQSLKLVAMIGKQSFISHPEV